jgi:hypothetical protein
MTSCAKGILNICLLKRDRLVRRNRGRSGDTFFALIESSAGNAMAVSMGRKCPLGASSNDRAPLLFNTAFSVKDVVK